MKEIAKKWIDKSLELAYKLKALIDSKLDES